MSFSVHANNRIKKVLVLCEGITQGLDNTTLIAEAKYSINFSKSNREFCLSLHYNGDDVKYKFKTKDFEIKAYLSCLENVSADFSVNNMIKTGLNGSVYDFFVDYNVIDTSNIINIHKYINNNEPTLYSFSISVNKCSESCSNINDPYVLLKT